MVDDIIKIKLKNGLLCYIRKTNIGSDLAHMTLVIRAGSLVDGKKKVLHT